MKYKFKKEIITDTMSDGAQTAVACIIAKCLALSGFEVSEEIYNQLTKDEQKLFEDSCIQQATFAE